MLTQRLKAGVEADLEARREELVFELPRAVQDALKKLLNDPRDLPVAILLLNIILTAIPGAVIVLYWGTHTAGAVFLACNYALYLQRFLVALLHVTEHRTLFRKEWNWLNHVTTLLVAPLYGLPCGMYKLHHRVMHHVEGNRSPRDSSSTETYQRDSLPDFLRYWARHAFGAWIAVPAYAFTHERWDLLWECLGGEVGYFVVAALIVRSAPVAALWLLLVPYVVTSFAIMFGNWSQHIFVDPEHPGDPFCSAYNCVDCKDNRRTFNDGYHILHHLNSQTHWSELPQKLLDNWDLHCSHRALNFVGIGFFDVGLMVMLGRLDRLADHCLPCGATADGQELSKEALIALMRARLKPISKGLSLNAL